MATVVKGTFRVLCAGPFEADGFGVVEVRVRKRGRQLHAEVRERQGSAIRFEILRYSRERDLFRLVTGTNAWRWVFRDVQ